LKEFRVLTTAGARDLEAEEVSAPFLEEGVLVPGEVDWAVEVAGAELSMSLILPTSDDLDLSAAIASKRSLSEKPRSASSLRNEH
jgi:hypothetical protein